MHKRCIGIDLGGTFIKFGLLDERGRTEGLFQLSTPQSGGGEAVIARMVEGVEQLLDATGTDPGEILGIGIGSPGPLDLQRGYVVNTPNIAGMTNVPLRDRVAEETELPVVLDNDANVAAFGEYIAGAGRGTSEMVLLTLGTGVGGGLVLGNRIFHGAHGIGAELGHMIVQPDGRQCNCGQRGCLEQYASAHFLALRAMELMAEGRESSLSAKLADSGAIDARDVNEARRAGDALAAEVWDRAVYYLALACVSICRILDPDRIVFGGGMAKAGDDLLDPLREHIDRQDWRLDERRTRVAVSTLGNDAGLIGAAGLAFQAFDGRSEAHWLTDQAGKGAS